jgi:hypothetical protein
MMVVGGGNPLTRVVTSPASYAVWMAFVLVTLLVTYSGNPYIFGFAVFALAGLSAVVALAGLVVAVSSRSLSGAARAVIIASVVVAMGSTAVALMVLSTFKWA